MNRAMRLLAELRTFARYDVGKAIKGTNGKEIKGSTAIASNASVFYDKDPTFGGHFLERYDLNDNVEKFRLTHENAKHLLGHLKKYVNDHENEIAAQGKGDNAKTFVRP